MKKTILKQCGMPVLFVILSALSNQSNAQSNSVASNSSNNESYDYAYTTTKEELAAMEEDRIFERGYAYKKKAATKSNLKAGGSYGIIIESSYTNEIGKLVTIHSVSSGCSSLEDAKKVALQNLKKKNPNWASTNSYKVVAKFENR